MIRVGIAGFGNLGRGVACAMAQHPDLQLKVIFSRRSPSQLSGCPADVPVVSAKDILGWKELIDVLILCGGSAADLPSMTPYLARHFHVVDSFDTHALIPAHFQAADRAARSGGHLVLISAGWDPGLFSLNRLYASAVLPDGQDCTFWGVGVSQGHSDAIRRIPGVRDARQYTIPREDALARFRAGGTSALTSQDCHRRHCVVAAEEGADRAAIESAIKAMPHYFSGYETTVEFVSLRELREQHTALPHGGHVIRRGATGQQREFHHTIEYSLTLDSNPQFTGSVLAACARAVYRMAHRGEVGCRTLFDIPPADLSPLSRDELLSRLL